MTHISEQYSDQTKIRDLGEVLEEIVGIGHMMSGDAIEPRYIIDILSKHKGAPAHVVRPGSTDEVSRILKIASSRRVPVTPLGGRTGVVGGGACSEGGIVISLERMTRCVELDAQTMTMTVEAGATVQHVQELAEESGLLMPLDLGSRGSASIGGAIATNAGGIRVIRWGMMRDMVLGIEAVLADGTIVSRLNKIIKDNSGYDWKQLLIGSEGTLGIVTKVVLRLRPLPVSSQSALVALKDVSRAASLLRTLQLDLGGQLTSFELMWKDFYDFVSAAQSNKRPAPMERGYPLYVLVDFLGADKEHDAALFERILAKALEDGVVLDAVVAQSERERLNLWALRDDILDIFAPIRSTLSFDVSVPLLEMPRLIEETGAALRAALPNARLWFYGHAGDGNIHLILADPALADPATVHKAEDIFYSIVGAFGGSISAEHGVGVAKQPFLSKTRSQEEIMLMRAIKHALDPLGILNPGKIFLAEES